MNAAPYQAIDPAVLMAAASDRATFDLLGRTYLEHAPRICQQLQQALDGVDHVAIGQQSHALKGMTMLIGATGLTELLRRLEEGARACQLDAAAALALALAPCHALVMAEMTHCLDAGTCAGGSQA